jgi:hypothetical protein
MAIGKATAGGCVRYQTGRSRALDARSAPANTDLKPSSEAGAPEAMLAQVRTSAAGESRRVAMCCVRVQSSLALRCAAVVCGCVPELQGMQALLLMY